MFEEISSFVDLFESDFCAASAPGGADTLPAPLAGGSELARQAPRTAERGAARRPGPQGGGEAARARGGVRRPQTGHDGCGR